MGVDVSVVVVYGARYSRDELIKNKVVARETICDLGEYCFFNKNDIVDTNTFKFCPDCGGKRFIETKVSTTDLIDVEKGEIESVEGNEFLHVGTYDSRIRAYPYTYIGIKLGRIRWDTDDDMLIEIAPEQKAEVIGMLERNNLLDKDHQPGFWVIYDIS